LCDIFSDSLPLAVARGRALARSSVGGTQKLAPSPCSAYVIRMMNAPTTDTAQTKAQLRQHALERRQNIPLTQRVEYAQSVKLHFIDFPHLTYAKSFAGYYAVRGEVDILPIFNHMAKYEKHMALPRTHGQYLTFHSWRPGEPLQDDHLGIKVPFGEAHFIPEVVLVPLLAFDARGYRLGYGGGYYDRSMQALRQMSISPLFIGVAYSDQEVPDLPTEPHDQKLDGILTEKGVSLFS
jgi:5-formyltetrahydrofolate cyclo-ligase